MTRAPRLRVALQQGGPIPMDVDFVCGSGEVLAVFGASGSGKTTILRSIAGLYSPVTARVELGDDVWTDTARQTWVPPHRRPIGFVFQDYALFPHLTAAGNVELALRDVPRRERAARVEALLEGVHLTNHAARRPHGLSGGERQRVALARALARDPRVLLLDEPFSAVDRPTRRYLRTEVDNLRRSLHVPTVLVTHDLEDVIQLATHLLILDAGRAIACGALAEVLAQPDLPVPRDLIGVGSVIEGVVAAVDRDRGLTTITFDGGELVAPHTDAVPGARVRVRVPAREVILADRAPTGLSLHNAMRGVVTALSMQHESPYVVVQVAVGRTPVLAEITRDAVERLPVTVGRELYVLIKSVALEL